MIAIMMSECHQPYSEIMAMPTRVLRGVIESLGKMRQAAIDAQKNTLGARNDIDGVNTGDISDEDMDTSMWFREES